MTWARGNSSAISIALLRAERRVFGSIKRGKGQTTIQHLFRDLKLEEHEH